MPTNEPVNIEDAMGRFFASNCRENPILKYEESYSNSPSTIVDETLLLEATRILESDFQTIDNNELVDSLELKRIMESYIFDLGMRDKVDVVISPTHNLAMARVVKPGSFAGSKAKLLVYLTAFPVPKHLLDNLCAHELGTHLLRMHNNDFQIWSKGNRLSFHLGNHINTEEGLATLNGLIASMRHPCSSVSLWSAALRYYAVILGKDSDFSTLFQQLERFIPNRETRFRYCCRVKRGFVNTSRLGTPHTDQSYFLGAVDLLRFRNDTDFVALYSGMVDRKDLIRLRNLSRLECLILPPFLRDEAAVRSYHEKLEHISRINKIPCLIVSRVPRSISKGLRHVRRISRSRSLTISRSSERPKYTRL